MERIVKIRVNGGDFQDHSVVATTFGELKEELPSIDWADKKVVVREGRHTLEDDLAVLPSTAFSLFLFPIKIKAGMDDIYDDMSYKELRTACGERDTIEYNGGYGDSSNMRATLREDDETSVDGAKDAVIEKIEKIIDQLEELQEEVLMLNSSEIDSHLVQLNKEFEEVRESFKL